MITCTHYIRANITFGVLDCVCYIIAGISLNRGGLYRGSVPYIHWNLAGLKSVALDRKTSL